MATHVNTPALAHGTVSCAPAYPTGLQADDHIWLVGAINPSTATAPTLSGWTKQVDQVVGSRRLAVYKKDAVSGSESGTQSFAPGSSPTNVSAGMTAWRPAAGTPSIDYGYGQDTSSNTTLSVTADHVLGEATGDTMLVCTVASTNTGITVSSVTATGATYGTYTARTQSGTTNLRLAIGDRPITAGAATAATVLSGTLGAAATAGAAFIRIREVTAKSGTASGGVSWAGSAAGKETPKGAASGTVSWVGSAAGKRTPEGAVSGTVAWAGAAAGGRTPEGAATGGVAWAGSAAGRRAPVGAAAGGVSWVGAAAGERSPAGAASGGVAWSGAATGDAPRTGQAAGAWSVGGSAEGARSPEATASGAVSWVGAAQGQAPEADQSAGSAHGAVSWAGSAEGQRGREGAAAGGWGVGGTAAGVRVPVGATVGAYGFTGDAFGKRDPVGEAAGGWGVAGAGEASRPSVGSAAGTVSWSGTAKRGATMLLNVRARVKPDTTHATVGRGNRSTVKDRPYG